MDETRMKRLFYFSVAVLVSIVLFWVGTELLLFTNDHISQTAYVVTGLLLMLGGVFTAADIGFTKLWWISGVIILLGLYSLARAWDAIDSPILARFLGGASWVAALILLYVFWPGRKTKPKGTDNANSPTI